MTARGRFKSVTIHLRKYQVSLKGLLRELVGARKWLAAYLVIVLLPASFMIYFYSQRATTILVDEVTQTMLQTLKQAGTNIDYHFDRVEDLSDSLIINPVLISSLSTTGTAESYTEQHEQLKDLREKVVVPAQTNNKVVKIRTYVDESKNYSREGINFFSLSAVYDMPWVTSAIDAAGSSVWGGLHLQRYLDQPSDYVFSNARVLRFYRDFNVPSGLLVIDLDMRAVSDVVAELGGVGDGVAGAVYLVDEHNIVTYHSDLQTIGHPLVDEVQKLVAKQAEGVHAFFRDDRKHYAIFTSLRTTNWKLVMEVPQEVIAHRVVELNQFSGITGMLGTTLLFVILLFVLQMFFVRGMSRRVQKVVHSIRREGIENLDEQRAEGTKDNRLLESSVDVLIHKLHRLMGEAYTAKVQEREALLRALQAQINPHFLYNTLDSINWLARKHNAPDISRMIDGLAQYFRLSLNKGQDLVSVTDELELAKVYLEIQRHRFKNSFEYEINGGIELSHYVMPKLTLQPLLENALLHGIQNKRNMSGRIQIEAYTEGEGLWVVVSDDGVGMDPQKAKRLLHHDKSDADPTAKGSSYGLFNVHERIRLFSGEGYGLNIHSEPGKGTVVTVCTILKKNEN